MVGAGPVGIYIASLLLAKGHKVHLIEVGEEDFESNLLTYRHYEFVSKSAMPLNVHRVGGGSNLWHARIGHFLESDFEPLLKVGIEGWPIKWDELQKYYMKIINELTGEALTDEKFIQQNYAHQQKIVNSEGLELRLFRFADNYSFRDKYNTLKQSSNFVTSTSSRVDEIVSTQSGNHEDLSYILTKKSGRYQIKADQIIVTAGSIQSTKLILNSKDLCTPQQVNVVGTGLMEHMEGFIGVMKVPKSNEERLKLFLLNKNNRVAGTNSGIGIRNGTKIVRELNLPSFHVELRPLTRTINQPEKILGEIIPNPLHVVERIAKYVIFKTTQLIDFFCQQTTCGIWIKSEELRNPESTLKIPIPETSNKVIYDHRISIETFEKLFVNIDVIIKPLSQVFESKVKLKRWVRRRIPNPKFGVNWHPMGTLPMGENPNTSVCDKNLALHSNKRIFLVSAAVFNRGSNSNPTTTALALAAKLVEEQF